MSGKNNEKDMFKGGKQENLVEKQESQNLQSYASVRMPLVLS